MTKGYLTCLSSLLPVPFITLALMGHGSFYLSIACIAAFVFLAGGYHATAVTMIENVAKNSSETEKMVSAWMLYTSIFHSLSPILFGIISTHYNALAHPVIYGRILIGFIASGYLPAVFYFWKGGRAYQNLMEERAATATAT